MTDVADPITRAAVPGLRRNSARAATSESTDTELQPPGWWLASDGNWYPPHTTTRTLAAPGEPTVERGRAEARPGWVRGADGNWYPAETKERRLTSLRRRSIDDEGAA